MMFLLIYYRIHRYTLVHFFAFVGIFIEVK